VTVCADRRQSIIAAVMRFMHKAVSSFCCLILATGSAVANEARQGKKGKKATAATVQRPVADQQIHLGALPVTTTSSEAREYFDAGIRAWEMLQTDSALKRWRTAINIDPQFALAHLFLSYATPDPVEAQVEREKAKSLVPHATFGEQLLIAWFDGVRENEYLSGIAAMNDLLQQYPQDKHLLVWAGSWLFHQKEYELAQERLEQAAAIDPDFASPLNDLGYIYAYLGDYHHALQVMQHYVALLPGQPNPEDSYAEILRIAARYEEALEHYRNALTIDPNFHSSQLGIADTYALRGQQSRARKEYFNARVLATDKVTELQDVMQSAFTYVRERDLRGADLAFQGVAQQARHAGLSILEAEAWRMRARLQIITAPAHLVEVDTAQTGKRLGLIPRKRVQRPELEYLQKAEQAITEAKAISESDRQDEHALLLRERVEAAAARGLFAEAGEGLAKLDGMATDSPSSVIQTAFNGAKGRCSSISRQVR
jgi:tetratricopeptide (TPR) repeat protein